jgi:hypothetical protein
MNTEVARTAGGNSNHGCRCDDCRIAMNQMRREWRARLAESGWVKEHGTRNGYVTYNCRCDLCRAANAAYNRGLRARKKAAA